MNIIIWRSRERMRASMRMETKMKARVGARMMRVRMTVTVRPKMRKRTKNVVPVLSSDIVISRLEYQHFARVVQHLI